MMCHNMSLAFLLDHTLRDGQGEIIIRVRGSGIHHGGPQRGAWILEMQMGSKDVISGRMDRMRKGNRLQIPLPCTESSV